VEGEAKKENFQKSTLKNSSGVGDRRGWERKPLRRRRRDREKKGGGHPRKKGTPRRRTDVLE